MILTEYINSKISIEELLSMQKEKVIMYDFLKQGDEPDRCNLINMIYQRIFPWYDKKLHAGDTINTYRIAIKKFYGNYYRFLDRKRQLEIISIIKKYTPHENDQIFEFKEFDKNGNPYYQICNNYQLGNFIIFPTKSGINPKRSKTPYLDFFDNFIKVIYDYYEEKENFQQDDDVKNAVVSQSEYFAHFDNFSDYINSNYLRDFFLFEEDEENCTFIELSDSENFEEYVSKVTKIITNRGQEIWIKLTQNDNELFDEKHNRDEEKLIDKISKKSSNYRIKYKLDDTTANKLAELVEIENFFNNRNSLIDEQNNQIEEMKDTYSIKTSNVKGTFYIKKKFEWLKWWIWPILFIGWGWFYNIYSNHLRNLRYSKSIEYKVKLLYSSSNMFYLLFWISLISIIIYRNKHNKKAKNFEQKKLEEIENLETTLNKKIKTLSEKNNVNLENFDTDNKEIINLFYALPENYQNEEDVSSLIFFIKNRRADNFKEAYEVLENEKHRQRLELEARRQTWIAEETAREQDRAAQEAIDNARLQTQAAEELTRETERHNREIESRWNRNN